MAIQLVKLQGANVCTTVSSRETDFVHQPGADHTILDQETDFVQAALDWTQGEGIDLALDTVGRETFDKTFSALLCL